MAKRPVFVIGLLLLAAVSTAQKPEESLRAIFNEALTDTTAYNHLRYLCANTKGRIPGSPAAAEAVEYTRQALLKAGADTVWLQRVPVPHWERGSESARVISSVMGTADLTISALGLSVGTTADGLLAAVIEVKDISELKKIGRAGVEGRIVFFNRKVDNTLINTFAGYAGAVEQRTRGASEAARYGAAAVIVRSVTQALHDFPHTGVTRYEDGVNHIPAVAVSTAGAEKLSSMLRADPALKIHLVSTCRNYPDTWSYNVIGEIRGSHKPNEYVISGGHLDSWDISEGAHDDAGGCLQAIEMIRIYKKLGLRPKRSFRAVMFMNEEMTGTGGRTYAEEAAAKGEIHYAAHEADRGVMSPLGFGFDATGDRLQALKALASYFQPYNIRNFDQGGGGSDISPLKPQGTLLMGIVPDTHRYFFYHHSANDTFDQVNIREFQMGSAATASLLWLIDYLDL
jgi:carboxypeptidase Q